MWQSVRGNIPYYVFCRVYNHLMYVILAVVVNVWLIYVPIMLNCIQFVHVHPHNIPRFTTVYFHDCVVNIHV